MKRIHACSTWQNRHNCSKKSDIIATRTAKCFYSSHGSTTYMDPMHSSHRQDTDKQETSKQCWFTVGSASPTVVAALWHSSPPFQKKRPGHTPIQCWVNVQDVDPTLNQRTSAVIPATTLGVLLCPPWDWCLAYQCTTFREMCYISGCSADTVLSLEKSYFFMWADNFGTNIRHFYYTDWTCTCSRWALYFNMELFWICLWNVGS